jgi:hypothetical protein
MTAAVNWCQADDRAEPRSFPPSPDPRDRTTAPARNHISSQLKWECRNNDPKANRVLTHQEGAASNSPQDDPAFDSAGLKRDPRMKPRRVITGA